MGVRTELSGVCFQTDFSRRIWRPGAGGVSIFRVRDSICMLPLVKNIFILLKFVPLTTFTHFTYLFPDSGNHQSVLCLHELVPFRFRV